MNSRLLFLLFLLAVFTPLGCGPQGSNYRHAERVITLEMRFGDKPEELLDGISHLGETKTDKSAILYAGLPSRDSSDYETEKSRNKVAEFSKDEFYDHPSEIDDATNSILQSTLGNINSYLPLSKKLCDGFHADWCIVWHLGPDAIRFHICFGCEEVKIYYKDREYWCDLDRAARDRLRPLLTGFRKYDPKNPSAPQTN